MHQGAKNAMRSGVVVLGALAFGYLTLRLGFKPYLDKAQQSLEEQLSKSSSSDHQLEGESGGVGLPTISDSPPNQGGFITPDSQQ